MRFTAAAIAGAVSCSSLCIRHSCSTPYCCVLPTAARDNDSHAHAKQCPLLSSRNWPAPVLLLLLTSFLPLLLLPLVVQLMQPNSTAANSQDHPWRRLMGPCLLYSFCCVLLI